jgi:hypothetical protein
MIVIFFSALAVLVTSFIASVCAKRRALGHMYLAIAIVAAFVVVTMIPVLGREYKSRKSSMDARVRMTTFRFSSRGNP